MNSKFYFNLDLQVAQSQVSIPVLKGDTAREWHISFSDGGKPVHLEDVVIANLQIKRPSGTFINQTCSIKNNTTVVYNFMNNTNTASVVGLHNCNVILYSADAVVGSARFSMIVSDRVINSDDINLTDEDITVIDAIVSAEAAREVAEKGRVDAETERVSAEAKRVSAETAREVAFEGEVDKVDDKIYEITQKASNGDFDGFSPIVEVTEVTEGHKISITDRTSKKTFTVLNGKQGDVGAVAKYTVRTTLDYETYVLTVAIYDENGKMVASDAVDFPIESVVVGADEQDGIITLTLQNGKTTSFEIGDMLIGLAKTTEVDAKIANAITTTLNTEV